MEYVIDMYLIPLCAVESCHKKILCYTMYIRAHMEKLHS